MGKLEPITVIIGRNNSGKSAIVDALKIACRLDKFDSAKHSRGPKPPQIAISSVLKAEALRMVFPENTSGGGLPGNHWTYGRQFIGSRVTVSYGSDLQVSGISGVEMPGVRASAQYLEQLARTIPYPLTGVSVLGVNAERDVQPEGSSGASGGLFFSPSGQGLTNMVRAFINRDSLPRDAVEVDLLRDLNAVYRGDSNFTRISCRESESNAWEIFLEEEGKGSIRLSQSGSSLKSIFIILSLLRLVPLTQKVNFDSTLLIVEEPENNLHPSLLRRLLEFLAKARGELKFTMVIATHSPIAIDWISRRQDGKILHVTHDGSQASVREATGYLHYRDVLDDLDIRASDILQANGVVWVEGPSDRIYLRRWLELVSDGALKEGVHYSVLFYGGKLLSHLSALPPDEQGRLVNTLSINRNVAVVMDSDRYPGVAKVGKGQRKPRMHLNETKKRIIAEVEGVQGLSWVTDGREIENYLPERVLTVLAGLPSLPIGQYEKVPEHPQLKEYKGDKIALAAAASAELNLDDVKGDALLLGHLGRLSDRIRSWNSL